VARENGKDGECNEAGRPIGRCRLLIGHQQQIFAMAGVCRISTTAARIFLEKANQRGHQKKGYHQGDDNQQNRSSLNVKGKGHGG